MLYFRGSKRFNGSGHYHRRPRTQQELREPIKTRASRNELPTSYDDLQIKARRNHNWKRYRKTRWK